MTERALDGCDHSFSNPKFDGERCENCRDYPACKSCSHPTPHKRVGPVKDLSGFRHADACELCPCIADPLFEPPLPRSKGHLAVEVAQEAISALRGSCDYIARGKAQELQKKLGAVLVILLLLALPAYGQTLPHSPLTGAPLPGSPGTPYRLVMPSRITITITPRANVPADEFDVVHADGKREVIVWRQRALLGPQHCPIQTLVVDPATGTQLFDLDVSLISIGDAAKGIPPDYVQFESRSWYVINDIAMYDAAGKRINDAGCGVGQPRPEFKTKQADWTVACGGVPVKPVPERRRPSRPPSNPPPDPCKGAQP